MRSLAIYALLATAANVRNHGLPAIGNLTYTHLQVATAGPVYARKAAESDSSLERLDKLIRSFQGSDIGGGNSPLRPVNGSDTTITRAITPTVRIPGSNTASVPPPALETPADGRSTISSTQRALPSSEALSGVQPTPSSERGTLRSSKAPSGVQPTLSSGRGTSPSAEAPSGVKPTISSGGGAVPTIETSIVPKRPSERQSLSQASSSPILNATSAATTKTAPAERLSSSSSSSSPSPIASFSRLPDPNSQPYAPYSSKT